MNSPECWRWGQGLCPGYRGYALSFGAWLNPIVGEYLEIPSIAGIHITRYQTTLQIENYQWGVV